MQFFGAGWIVYEAARNDVGLCVFEYQEFSLDEDPDVVNYTLVWEDGVVSSVKSKEGRGLQRISPLVYNPALREYMFSDLSTLESDYKDGVFRSLFETGRTSLSPKPKYFLKVA